jgi:carbamoyltransferase
LVHILGLSALARDTAAALLGESGVVAAIEESKLARRRDAGGIPREAARFCLEHAHISWRDLRTVAVASRPFRAWARAARMRLAALPAAPFSTGYYQAKALGDLGRELNNFRILRLLAGDPAKRDVVAFDHHLCHAASAFFGSPFDRAAVLTLDEQGEGICGVLAVGEGVSLRVLRRIRFPHSPAWVFSQVTDLLGFAPRREEHKTQWLALEGEAKYRELFLAMLGTGSASAPRLRRSYFTRGLAGRLAFGTRFYRELGIAEADRERMSPEMRSALAASVQAACTEVALTLAEQLRERSGARNLCLAGGLFLNPLLVSDLAARAGFDTVFVQPAAGNEGTALGAAWMARHGLHGQPRTSPPVSLALGPAAENSEIKRVLDNAKARYRWLNTEDERVGETVALLDAGKIVGWFQGRAEFGPRALGHRSLLASPWAEYVRENLNEYVKRREGFRPFAISAPAERADEWFTETGQAAYMTGLARARPEARGLLEGFLLPGDRVRLHAVARDTNPALWRLLEAFGRRAPAPMLVNTSFNLFGEPLAAAPRDAVRSYFCSGIDALAIGNFLLVKD